MERAMSASECLDPGENLFEACLIYEYLQHPSLDSSQDTARTPCG